MNTIYLIPIRKGSKGVPNKNMKKLGRKPLTAHVIDTILATGTEDEIWVATDSDETERYLSCAYGGRVSIYRRSDDSARDESPVIDVIREFLRAKKHTEGMLVLAQATSPFTSVEDFRCLQQEIDRDEHDSYVACQRVKKFAWSDCGESLSYRLDAKPRRQEYDGILLESGAFYATRIEALQVSGHLLSGRIRPIETSALSGIEIDEKDDWLLAEAICRTRDNQQNTNF